MLQLTVCLFWRVCVQVVGFTNGWHAALVMGSMAKLAHGRRMAQAEGIRLALKQHSPDGSPGTIHMQLDGEPWQQKIPGGREEPPVMVSSSMQGEKGSGLQRGQGLSTTVSCMMLCWAAWACNGAVPYNLHALSSTLFMHTGNCIYCVQHEEVNWHTVDTVVMLQACHGSQHANTLHVMR